MKTIEIHISDALRERLLSAMPASEWAAFALTALEEALDRRHTVTEKRPVGRPAPAIEKVKKTYNLDADVVDAVQNAATSERLSESAIANRILRSFLVDK